MTGPVWRGALLRLNEADQVLLLTFHHIVADGWSLGVLVREVSTLYALSSGEPPELPALAIQYADFAEWQNARLTDSAMETQLTEVVRHLEGAPTILELPTDFPRACAESPRRLVYPAVGACNLQRLAGSCPARGRYPVYAASRGIRDADLRFSGLEEMLIGTPVANRTRPETEDLVGFFVNTLVLRANLAGDPLFTELKDRVRRECLWAFERQEVPFERVVDAAAPVRDRRSTPLFQVYFTLQNSPQGDLKLPGVEISVLAVDTCSAKVDLTLGLEQSAGGLVGRWEYCTDVFTRETILRLADHFENLLEAIIDDPARRLSELPLLEASERDSLLRRGSQSAGDFDCGTLHDWFTRQAGRAPERVALTCEDAVPAAYVYLDQMKLTAHGKLDRHALPAPDPDETGVPAEYVEPATPAERALAEVWTRVLGVKTIGAQGNFFALGGDSILTIQVVSHAARAGYKLRPKDLFDHQTLADLARVVRPVSMVGDKALAVTRFTVSAADNDAISRALPSGTDVEDVYPLTPMQTGMLFHSTFAPESEVYLEQFSGDIRGELVPAAFRTAWQGLLDRHPSLRTTFLWREVSMPFQVVHRYAELPWDERDWSALAVAEQETAWKRLLAENRACGISLSRAPLLNVTLVRFGRDHWRWLWSHYHALLDGWCLPLVFQEVIAEYEYRINGTGNLPAPALPYRPYVEWVHSQSLPLAERYWRDALTGFEGRPALALPPPDRDAATSSVGELELRLGASESAELRRWVRRQGLTLNTLFQGAWALLLARYGAGDDIVFGVTVAGRPAELPEVERIIGLFINTLPLRVRIARNIEPAEWLRALQKAQAEMRQFEYSPLADVQVWSEAPRGKSLFETILVFENYPGEELVRGLRSSLRFDSLRAHEQTSYLLTAAVLPGVEIVLKLNYDPHRLAAEPVERMLRCWRWLAAELTASAGKRLDSLISLEPEEARTVLTWGRAPMDFGPPARIHDLVAEQTARSPEAPALLAPGREVTYRELMLHSSRLAVHLRRLGIRPEMRVAVCLEKSPELVMAWLGTLLAGGAFVPLDPRFARERIADVVDDARPVALILHQPTAWLLSLTDLPVVWIDREGAELPGETANLSLPAIAPENLAYVIHTSGSTGRPKGVMLTHSGLANLARAHAAACSLGPGHRGLQFASASFDAAVWEVFTALGSGAALCRRRFSKPCRRTIFHSSPRCSWQEKPHRVSFTVAGPMGEGSLTHMSPLKARSAQPWSK